MTILYLFLISPFLNSNSYNFYHKFTLTSRAISSKIKVFGVLPAHLPLVFDAGTVFVFVPRLICADFVYCHCTGRWAVLDNTHGKDSGSFRWGLLYSHYHGPYFYLTEVYTCYAMLQDSIKFILAMLCYRTVFMWLQGTWFWQIAYTLFNPSLGEKSTMDVNDPESVMVTTLHFSFHIIAACSCKLSLLL